MLVRLQLTELQTRIEAALTKADLKLDDYTRAHLLDAKLRIKQTLEAESEDFGKPQSSGGGGSFLLLGQPNGTGNEVLGELEFVPESQP